MRTWDLNKQAINQLWPMAQFTDEERRLWHDDLSGLDQSILYDAIRNVKRNNESLYPQLKWIREEYRGLHRLAQFSKAKAATGEKLEAVRIDADEEKRFREELRVAIDMATPSDFWTTVDLIADKAANRNIEMATAYRLVHYAIERLGVNEQAGGRIWRDGTVSGVFGGSV